MSKLFGAIEPPDRFDAGRRLSKRRVASGARCPKKLWLETHEPAADTVTFTRAVSAALATAKLAEYVGDYRSPEVDATHTWKVEKGQLVAYANDRRLGVLEPSYTDGFTRGSAVIDVQRDAKGRITGFVLEAGRVRHLRFMRVR